MNMEYMESLSDKNLLQDQLELFVLFIYLITLNPSQSLKVN